MKKYLLFFFFFLFTIVACHDKSTNPENPYQILLTEFNDNSGFHAVFVNDTGLVSEVKSWQGEGDYPGVDDWFAVNINTGSVVLGGLPGQSAFYSILKTYTLSKGNIEKYWKMLQVKPHAQFGYRPIIGSYVVNFSTNVVISKTLANPQFGEGGGWQLYIRGYDSVLTKFAETPLDTNSVN